MARIKDVFFWCLFLLMLLHGMFCFVVGHYAELFRERDGGAR